MALFFLICIFFPSEMSFSNLYVIIYESMTVISTAQKLELLTDLGSNPGCWLCDLGHVIETSELQGSPLYNASACACLPGLQ